MSQFVFPPVSATLAGGATEAKQDTMITELQALNTDTDTLVAVDYSTETTLASVLTELQAKADLAETQPVSAASLPLPTGAATEATLATIDADTSALAGTVSGSELQVDVITSALPTGAATEATLATIDADTSSIATDASTIAGDTTSIDGKITACDTGAVVISSSALPTGAATSANQTTGNASLSSIDGKLATLGQKVMSGSVPVAIAGDQSTISVSLASTPLPSGASTAALQSTGNTTLSTISGKLGTLGQKTMTGSAPVVIASNQSTLPVSAASLPLPTGAATAANQATEISSLSSMESDLADLNARLAGNLVPETFDYLALTYVAAGNGTGEIETVVYKTGGSGGSTVATLTLAYDGSDRLSTVTRS